MRHPGEHLGQAAAHHHLDDALRGEVRRGPAADVVAVAQDGEAVGDALDLFEEVRDVHHRHAAVAQPAYQGEQPFGVGQGQRAGRLVQHQHAHVQQQGAGDLDELLQGRAEAIDGAVWLDFRVFEHGQGVAHPPPAFRAPQQAAPRRLQPEQDVGLDAEVGREGQFLVDHGDAEPPRLQRPGRRIRHAAQSHPAAIGPLGAAEDFHERRFAGAVFADQRMDLAGAQCQIDAAQGVRRAETLAHVGHLEMGHDSACLANG